MKTNAERQGAAVAAGREALRRCRHRQVDDPGQPRHGRHLRHHEAAATGAVQGRPGAEEHLGEGCRLRPKTWIDAIKAGTEAGAITQYLVKMATTVVAAIKATHPPSLPTKVDSGFAGTTR